MRSSAIISLCGTYRYTLSREWDDALPCCRWIMLNPSTADDRQDDPTIRRCIGFARAWGYGSIRVYNLFALRATNPDALRTASDPIGPDNDMHLRSIERTASKVAAWGTHGEYLGRGDAVRSMVPQLSVLGFTKCGHPRHPLYVRADTELQAWSTP